VTSKNLARRLERLEERPVAGRPRRADSAKHHLGFVGRYAD